VGFADLKMKVSTGLPSYVLGYRKESISLPLSFLEAAFIDSWSYSPTFKASNTQPSLSHTAVTLALTSAFLLHV
jgi:hypothetical protein